MHTTTHRSSEWIELDVTRSPVGDSRPVRHVRNPSAGRSPELTKERLTTVSETLGQQVRRWSSGWMRRLKGETVADERQALEWAAQRESGVWLTPTPEGRWSIQVHWSFPPSKPPTIDGQPLSNDISSPNWSAMPILRLVPPERPAPTGSSPRCVRRSPLAQPSLRRSGSARSSRAGRPTSGPRRRPRRR